MAFSGLFRRTPTIRVSPSDSKQQFLIDKFKAGENIILDLEEDPELGEQITISANKTEGRRVQTFCEDGVVSKHAFLVLVDASRNSVKLMLPPAHEYVGNLSIVCVDPSHGIEIVPACGTDNTMFDMSNADFNAKGDSLTFVSDRQCHPGTWYIVGRYTALWYA